MQLYMENEDGGLRYSDRAYYCSFSSDEDESEDDPFGGVFKDYPEDTPMPDYTSSDKRMKHGYTPSVERKRTPNSEDKSKEDGSLDDWCGYVRFNGKNIKKLCLKDFDGVGFASIDDAEKMYTYYSHVVGFSTRRFKLDKNKKGQIVRRGWVCSKQGQSPGQIKKKNLKSGKCYVNEQTQCEKKKQRKFSVSRGIRYTRVFCPAALTIRYSRERGVYYVSTFVTHHNHELARPEEVQFLRSHRAVKEHDIAQVEALRGAQVHTSRAYEYLVHQAGGYQYVGFSMKDLYNNLEKRIRAQKLDCDAQSVVTWMNMKGCVEKDFYCKFNSDGEGRLANMFWRDAQSLKDYESFGDVLIVDSTYKTNLYGKPLVVFVGANNHRATIVFGFALTADEKEETYTWVFENFLASMNQKCPIAVLTDGDEAVRNVIHNLMPDARHRLCAWHIGRNIGQNVKDAEAQKSLAKLIYASVTIPEWEEAWQCIVARNGLENNQWVTSLFNKRDRWAEAYFRGQFFGGMCSTQRCEGMHSKLKKEIGRYTRLCEVMPRLEKTIGRIRNRVLEDNFRSKNCVRVFDSHMRGMEEEAYKIFTDDIFVMVKSQINYETRFVISRRVAFANNDSVVFYVSQYGRPARKWCVEYLVHERNPQLKCSCKLFESDGIPCAHIFCVLKMEMVIEYPKSLVMDRWTKAAGENILPPKIAKTFEGKAAQVARYSALIAECSKACFNSSFSDEGFNEAMTEFSRLAEASRKYKDAHQEKNHNVAGSNNNVLRDPIMAKTKGMHSNTATNIEPSRTEPRLCGKCGLPGHNRRTCKLANQSVNSVVADGSSQRSMQGEDAGAQKTSQVNPCTLNFQEHNGPPYFFQNTGHPTYGMVPPAQPTMLEHLNNPSTPNASNPVNCLGGDNFNPRSVDFEAPNLQTTTLPGYPSGQFGSVSGQEMDRQVAQGMRSRPTQWTTNQPFQPPSCWSQPPSP